MARYAEPDQYQNASLVNGLPTCTFSPKPYNRKIVNIVVGNGLQSTVACYRAQLGSVPVAQNQIGQSNTLRGTINLPAGQTFFVQWSVAATPVSLAFARVTFERDDNPFAGADSGHSWDTELIDSLTIGDPNGDRVVIGGPEVMPAAVVAFYAPGEIIGGTVYFDGPNDYTYEVYVNPTIGRSFIASGGIESVGLILRETYRIAPGPAQNDFFINGNVNLRYGNPSESIVQMANWVPVWTNVTLVNGVVVARYKRIGDDFRWRLRYVVGNLDLIGANPTFSIPFNVDATSYPAFASVGTGKILDASTGNGKPIEVRRDATAATFSIAYWEATPVAAMNLAAINAGAPWPWAVNDVFDCWGMAQLV